MALHIAEHAEYGHATLHLGTVRYSVGQGLVSFQHIVRELQKEEAQYSPVQGPSTPHRQTRAKRALSEQHDEKLAEQLRASQKQQSNDLLGAFTKLLQQQEAKEAKKAEAQEARRAKKAKLQEALQLKQDKMLDAMLQLAMNQAADHELLRTLVTSQSSLSCPSRNISLAQAEEVVQMHKTYQRNARLQYYSCTSQLHLPVAPPACTSQWYHQEPDCSTAFLSCCRTFVHYMCPLNATKEECAWWCCVNCCTVSPAWCIRWLFADILNKICRSFFQKNAFDSARLFCGGSFGKQNLYRRLIQLEPVFKIQSSTQLFCGLSRT